MIKPFVMPLPEIAEPAHTSVDAPSSEGGCVLESMLRADCTGGLPTRARGLGSLATSSLSALEQMAGVLLKLGRNACGMTVLKHI